MKLFKQLGDVKNGISVKKVGRGRCKAPKQFVEQFYVALFPVSARPIY